MVLVTGLSNLLCQPANKKNERRKVWNRTVASSGERKFSSKYISAPEMARRSISVRLDAILALRAAKPAVLDSPSHSVSAFVVLTKRNQIPLSILLRRALVEDIKIPIAGANLEEDAFQVVPPVENRLDSIRFRVKPEAGWPFIRLSARMTLDF